MKNMSGSALKLNKILSLNNNHPEVRIFPGWPLMILMRGLFKNSFLQLEVQLASWSWAKWIDVVLMPQNASSSRKKTNFCGHIHTLEFNKCLGLGMGQGVMVIHKHLFILIFLNSFSQISTPSYTHSIHRFLAPSLSSHAYKCEFVEKNKSNFILKTGAERHSLF